LWELVWAGVVTNDTFAPLRSFGQGSLSHTRGRTASGASLAGGQPAGRRTGPHGSFGGRWSLVESLGPSPSPTARAHALATALLARWGIASVTAARADEVPFSAVADVLRAMEDAGTARRGYFVAGLDGAQYAWPAAIDRLRERVRGAPRVDTLATIDPACAWGSALPWPQLADATARPARRAGTSVVQVDGVLALWIEAKGARIATAPLPHDVIALALTVGVARLAAIARRREILIEMIDGVSPNASQWRDVLLASGGRVDYRGVVVGSGGATQLVEDDPEDA
jgi:ATP-dependent Lhr-like helicase